MKKQSKKKNWVQKSFWSKKALGLKNFQVKKNFGKKNFGQKNLSTIFKEMSQEAEIWCATKENMVKIFADHKSG